MKKLLFTVLILTNLFLLNSCSKNNAEVSITEQTYETVCDQILFIGDEPSFKVMDAINDQWNVEHGTSYELIPSVILPKRMEIDNKKTLGFFINGVGIPYSNTILKKGLNAISPNSHVPAVKLFGEALCKPQGDLVRSVYAELDCKDQLVCTNGNIICDNTVAMNQGRDTSETSGLTFGWSKDFLWILGWILGIILAIILGFLILKLLQSLWNRLFSKNTSSSTSTTESKNDCCKYSINNCKCSSPCCDNETTRLREIAKIAKDGKDNFKMSYLGQGKKPLEVHLGNNLPVTKRGREEMVTETVINIMGDTIKAKEVIFEFQENNFYGDYDEEAITELVNKIIADDNEEEE